MKRKFTPILFAVVAVFGGCTTTQNSVPVTGTWELISAITTEKDSTFSTFNPKNKMIKIINATHFAFLNHDMSGGKDTASAAFTAGGGSYTLADSTYTEHLDYYIDRQWEMNKFPFTVKITGDTLIQKGIEKLEKLGINRVIVEKYKRASK